MNVILAEGINLGLRKMADATNTHTFWELIRIGRWHVEGEAYDRALAMVVEAQAALPMARFWGMGTSASSDGQFFVATEQGEAMNRSTRNMAIPGLKAYSHVSDQYAPFATGDSCNGKRSALHPRWPADERCWTPYPRAVHRHGRLHRSRLCRMCHSRLPVRSAHPRPAIQTALRVQSVGRPGAPASVDRRKGQPSHDRAQLARHPAHRRHHCCRDRRAKPDSAETRLYPRQNELATALREVGRVERTLFMIDWILDAELQRRAQIGLNKGEAHHALKRAISFHRRGEIRDRSAEGQHTASPA